MLCTYFHYVHFVLRVHFCIAGFPTKMTKIIIHFSLLGVPVQAVVAAGAPPLLMAAVVPAEPDAEARGDACEIEIPQLANEPGVVSVQEFTGEEAAAIVNECKSSEISLDTFSFVDDLGWTYSANSIDKC